MVNSLVLSAQTQKQALHAPKGTYAMLQIQVRSTAYGVTKLAALAGEHDKGKDPHRGTASPLRSFGNTDLRWRISNATCCGVGIDTCAGLLSPLAAALLPFTFKRRQ